MAKPCDRIRPLRRATSHPALAPAQRGRVPAKAVRDAAAPGPACTPVRGCGQGRGFWVSAISSMARRRRGGLVGRLRRVSAHRGPDPRASSERQAPEAEEIVLHGHRIALRRSGSGPVLLMVHGITSNSETWRLVIPRLAERFTVIAPDLLGHGHSAKPT